RGSTCRAWCSTAGRSWPGTSRGKRSTYRRGLGGGGPRAPGGTTQRSGAGGACAAGRLTESELRALEDVACPGAGACGGQFTANTMSMAGEMLGISPMGLNDIPAVDARKNAAAMRAGKIVMRLVTEDLRPSKILTRAAFEN